ncbi:LysR family transcriptional regulator [bacterium M00.F.Ca.ET.228.01.1.1]|uniref:LysR family transcriptional regulator n=1 Tax=Paraburkholderia phenoliruptrix TaxID=252970 RepID=UPI001091D6D3|nr:LysR family transcriptional regulator [Paraburkholderia phenoliruptrix]TGP48156.1 LysR family transcriptional regulator [bacterium M00.F.Ca.ET.228.01.1.1]TGS05948.1 LysR family transcriptional regulator [bacterium M00.F.Ca.ET.191.01.1.1]TGU10883.1 LysR family transcriptional regulator [bacterium M00.F.Ca.ET.155.01.1.1]MBW0445196.1 LysR family transcriptional regulator [Paraburkholderia phenoliruptrix]MBW9095961.1 LysR family transcriptional regulator [Paraburkholderia phenoliruptrix]
MKTLDLEAIQAFVLVADLRSFTRAADALDSTQSAISLKLKRLEERLGHRLIERTPRMVRLSPKGEIFLQAARNLLSAHDDALAVLTRKRATLKVGISHHIVGGDLPVLLRHMHSADPGLLVEMRVSSSRDIEAEFDRGTLDAAVVLRHDDNRRDGETLLDQPFGWMATPEWTHRAGEPLRLATQAYPCRVRAMAVTALEEARVPWVEVFVGGGIATIGAAAQAGLAVAALALRVAPPGTVDVGPRLGLPPLPSREVVLYSSTSDKQVRAALRTLASAFRSAPASVSMHAPVHA